MTPRLALEPQGRALRTPTAETIQKVMALLDNPFCL
jgi:hypothetical protein